MLHLVFEQFVVICGMTGLESMIGKVEVIVVESQVKNGSSGSAEHHVVRNSIAHEGHGWFQALLVLMPRNLPARPGFPLTLASFGNLKAAPPHPRVRFPRSLRFGRPPPSLSSARPTPWRPQGPPWGLFSEVFLLSSMAPFGQIALFGFISRRYVSCSPHLTASDLH